MVRRFPGGYSCSCRRNIEFGSIRQHACAVERFGDPDWISTIRKSACFPEGILHPAPLGKRIDARRLHFPCDIHEHRSRMDAGARGRFPRHESDRFGYLSGFDEKSSSDKKGTNAQTGKKHGRSIGVEERSDRRRRILTHTSCSKPQPSLSRNPRGTFDSGPREASAGHRSVDPDAVWVDCPFSNSHRRLRRAKGHPTDEERVPGKPVRRQGLFAPRRIQMQSLPEQYIAAIRD